MYVGMVAFQPVGEGRAHIKADVLEVAGVGIGTIALLSDLLVEVLVGRRARLVWHQPRKGVFARRLIKVAIQRDKPVCAHRNTPDFPRVTPHRASRTIIGREALAQGMVSITNG